LTVGAIGVVVLEATLAKDVMFVFLAPVVAFETSLLLLLL
jgi:hypothetical protein